MKIFGKNFDDKKVKKFVYTAVFVVLIGWFVFRFIMVAIESRMTVFNPARVVNQNGTLIEYVTAHKQNGSLGMPVSVKNNRAYVSGAVRTKLRAGQKIGDGVIVSVSSGLDLDSGMYVVKTRNVVDGINYVQIDVNGYFVPAYAVHDGVVFVADSGTAVARSVTIAGQDSDVACISDGIKDGDIVITSKVTESQKVKVQQ